MQANRQQYLNPRKSRFLVLLYGTVEFDGRVQRMLEILVGLGAEVCLIDMSSKAGSKSEIIGVERHQVQPPGGVGKIKGHLALARSALRIARSFKPSVVIAEDYFTIGSACFAARIAGAKIVYDAHELIIPEPGKRMSSRKRFWYSLERCAIRRMDKVIAANEERAKLMAEHYSLDSKPIVMRNIPVTYDGLSEPDLTSILERYPMLARKNISEKIVLYQGDISLSRGLGLFIEAFLFLPDHYRLVVVGGGPDLMRLKEMAHELEEKGRFTAVGRVPHRDIRMITRLADLGIVTYPSEGLNNVYCAPNKLFEYAQGGIPVITTDQPPLRRILDQYKIGSYVGRKATGKEIAAMIRKIAEQGRRAYEPSLKEFLSDNNWENEAARVANALNSLN